MKLTIEVPETFKAKAKRFRKTAKQMAQLLCQDFDYDTPDTLEIIPHSANPIVDDCGWLN